MRKDRAAVVASVCAGLVGATAACSAVLGIADFTAGDGGTAAGRDATTGHDSGQMGDDGPASNDDGGIHLTCADEDGGAGAVGCPCNAQATEIGCNGYAQMGRLVCTNGVWTAGTACSAGSNCDTRPGNGLGTCATIDPNCMSAQPNEYVCVGSAVIQCGPDLVSETPSTTCSNACVDGGCTGVCTPGATQCVGNGVQTCSALGQWSTASACSELCTDGGCTTFPSCHGTGGNPPGPGADTSCGPGSSEEGGATNDCCSSYEVPGDTTFYRSFDNISGGLYTSMANPANISNFRLDGYEVTVGRFRNFVSAVTATNGWLPATGSGIQSFLNGGSGLAAVGTDAESSEPGWLASWTSNIATSAGTWNSNFSSCNGANWTDTPTTNEHRPINCITWYEAYAFCIWDGGFLPSEAEWNLAAGGGSDQREYPWPDSAGPADASPPDISCAFANYSPQGAAPCSATGTNDVGSESPDGDGKWGHSDLAGNVWEWNLDSFAAYLPCDNCANLGSSASRVTRGGSYSLVASALLASYRGNNTPATRDSSIGVRCARMP
jgi:sulfatase modifying factor 1